MERKVTDDEASRSAVDRSSEEVKRATEVYMKLQYLSPESLNNLLHSVVAEIERKGGLTKEEKYNALSPIKRVQVKAVRRWALKRFIRNQALAGPRLVYTICVSHDHGTEA